MNPFVIFIGLVVVAAGLLLFIVFKMRKARSLPASVRIQLWKEWEVVEKTPDAHRKILDAEKIIDHALQALGYQGTFADKLRTAGPRFSRVQALWDAHKLRNRIAHEVGMTVSDSEARRAVESFRHALKDLC